MLVSDDTPYCRITVVGVDQNVVVRITSGGHQFLDFLFNGVSFCWHAGIDDETKRYTGMQLQQTFKFIVPKHGP